MGFKYADRVYRCVKDTSPTEQLVLLALAHCANDKTGECFPSLVTLVNRTHLGRSTVIRSLDVLKAKGLIRWASGGRKKGGRALSNLYALTLPKCAPRKAASNVDEDIDKSVDNDDGTVPQRDPYPSQSGTMHGPGAGLCRVPERDTIKNRTIIYHPDDHNPPPEAAGEMPGRFDFGVARRNGTLGDVLKRVGDAKTEMQRTEIEKGPVALALEAVDRLDSKEDAKSFSIAMLRKNGDDCREVIYEFASQRRQGEMENVKNLAALLMKRLQALPDVH